MRKFFIQILLGITVLGVIVIFANRSLTYYAILEIENATIEPVRNIHVVVWQYQFALGDIGPGEIKKIKIEDYSDSSWKVEGLWSSGEHFTDSHGYITHGMNFSNKLTFGQNRSVTFTESE